MSSTTQNITYFANNPKFSPTVTIFNTTPSPSNWKGFRLMDEAYVPSTKQWYKLLSLDGDVADWQLQPSNSSDFIDQITGDVGSVSPVSNNVNLLGGTGVNTVGSGSTMTINVTGGGYEWTVVTGTSQTIAVNNGYFSNNAGTVTFTLPTIGLVGDGFRITGIQGAWTIAQNAGQFMRVGSQVSTTGAGGSISSTAVGDAISVVCAVANTTWVVVDGPQGNLKVI